VPDAPVDGTGATTISPLRPNTASPNSRINRLDQARGRIAVTASSAALAGHSGWACIRISAR
jgi:hypothetical protein